MPTGWWLKKYPIHFNTLELKEAFILENWRLAQYLGTTSKTRITDSSVNVVVVKKVLFLSGQDLII